MKPTYYGLWLLVFLFFNITPSFGQRNLNSNDLLPYTSYFSLSNQNEIEGKAAQILDAEIRKHQFIGLGELHQSRNLSLFTSGLLTLLHKNGFRYFAMEVGPHSANILQGLSGNPPKTRTNIQKINQSYGNKLLGISPLVFSDREEDAVFLEKASQLEFEFWGLDQEFFDSFEMHVDSIYALSNNNSGELKEDYLRCKKKIRKWNKKAAISRKFMFTCSLLSDSEIQNFFHHFEGNALAKERIRALRISWDIYCKNQQGLPSNQQRADYMKSNFDSLYVMAQEVEELPKVFVKMGSVHMSKGTTIFRVEDMGKHLEKRAAENSTKSLIIRHLRRYRDGKDLIGKRGWENVGLLMEVGKKDEWSLTDLRPIRSKIEKGELLADKFIRFEVFNYDYLLIPPDDARSKLNH